MKQIIQKIISDLSVLTPPFNPVQLKNIFEQHPNLEVSQTQEPLKEHVTKLNALLLLIEQCFAIASKKHTIALHQNHLDELKRNDESFQQKIESYEQQIQFKSDSLNASFLPLLTHINNYLQHQSDNTRIYSATVDSKTQNLAVEEFRVYINKILFTINLNNAKINLLQLKNQIGSLVIDLNGLGEACNTVSVMKDLQTIVSNHKIEEATLTEVRSKLIELNDQFKLQITPDDIQQKLKVLEKQASAIAGKLEKAQLEMSINTLDIKVKERLAQEYTMSADKAELIGAYQTKVPTVFSYINPLAWGTWVEDPKKYDASIKEAELSICYLQLLQNADILASEQTVLKAYKANLEQLLSNVQNTKSDIAEVSNLLLQIRKIFSQYKILTIPSLLTTNSPITDFYLTLHYNLSIIEHKLNHEQLILTKAQELSVVVRQINELRKQHQLSIEKDSLLESKNVIEEQTNKLPSQNLLDSHLELCQSHRQLYEELEHLLRLQREAQQQKLVNAAQIDKENIEAPEADTISTLNEEYSNLLRKMESNIEQIKILPSLDTIPDERQVSPKDEAPLIVVEQSDSIVKGNKVDSLSSSAKTDHADPIIGKGQTIPITDDTPALIDIPDKQSQLSAKEINTITTPLDLLQLKEDLRSESSQPLPHNAEQQKAIITPVLPPIVSEQSLPVNQVNPAAKLEQTSLLSDRQQVLLETPEPDILIADQPISPITDTSSSLLQTDVTLEQVEPRTSIHQVVNQEPVVTTTKEALQSDQITIPVTKVPVNEFSSPAKELSPSSVSPDKQKVHPTPEQMDLSTELLLTEIITTPEVTIQNSNKNEITEKNLGSQQVYQQLASNTAVNTSIELTAAIDEKNSSTFSGDGDALHAYKDGISVDTQNQSISPKEDPKGPSSQSSSQEELSKISIPPKKVEKPQNTDRNIIEQLDHFHQQISNLLADQSPDVQKWYFNLSRALASNITTNPFSYKCFYVLRDIYFEIKYQEDINVIQAYMGLCPNPAMDLNKLLSIKPDLPPTEEPFDEEKEVNEAPEEFKPLYTKYITLRNSYPVEGELLLQAIQTLRMAKIFKDLPDSSLSTTQAPSLSLDPRYEPLKRHRGFFKVWETIEDLYKLIVGLFTEQAEYEYSKRPCFFKTRTAQLLNEADLMIQKDLPPICVS